MNKHKSSCSKASCYVVGKVNYETLNTLYERKSETNNDNKRELLWDTRAYLTVTPHLDDFMSPLITTNQPKIMKGIAKGLVIEGIGTVNYSIKDDKGADFTITTQAFYTPEVTRRIFSPK